MTHTLSFSEKIAEIIGSWQYRNSRSDIRRFPPLEELRRSSPEEQRAIGEKVAVPFAGALPPLGVTPETVPAIEASYLGFLAAWMAWNHPLRLVATSFLLGMIAVAGNSLEMNSGLPSSSVHILMALVLIFLLAGGRIGRGRRA